LAASTVLSHRRRVLDLLVDAGLAGSPKSASLARGCTVELLDDLLRAGFATVATGTVGDGDRTTEIACVTITEAGWRALEGPTDTE